VQTQQTDCFSVIYYRNDTQCRDVTWHWLQELSKPTTFFNQFYRTTYFFIPQLHLHIARWISIQHFSNKVMQRFQKVINWIQGRTLHWFAVWLSFFQIPQDPCSVDPLRAQQQTINCVTMSPSEEVLVCSTSECQLYSFTLSTTDLGKVIIDEPLECLLSWRHIQHSTRQMTCWSYTGNDPTA